MSTNIQVSSELELDRLGQQLGQNAFQSFLLAGERHLVSGFERKNTDEVRFKNFYKGINDDAKKSMQEYFSSQSRLSLPQRSLLLGRLSQLEINDGLTFDKTFGTQFMSPSMRSTFIQHIRMPLKSNGSKTKGSAGHKQLLFNLDELKVTEAQDDYTVGFWRLKRTFNTTDETSLSILTIDETGDVHYGSRRTGNIREGRTRHFEDPLNLATFNIREGGSNFPKVYSVTIYGIERDSGGYNDFIRAAAAYAKEKVGELIEEGLSAVLPLPGPVIRMISNLVESFMGHLIDWLKDLFTNNDDLLGYKTYTATLNGYVGNWRSTGTNKTNRSWRLQGEGGTWDLKGHWLLK